MAYKFTKDFFKNALTYGEFISMTEKLVSEDRTTGTEQTPGRIAATKLNLQRMKRIYKTTEIIPGLKTFFETEKRILNLVIITEPWCGDGANLLPALSLISELSESVNLRIILRDEHPEIMDEYLTDGTKSIPMLIFLDGDFNEIAVWGSRPAGLTNFVKEYKSVPGYEQAELKKQIQLWYLNDKTVSAQNEILSLLRNAMK
jgi:hypothetical protein